MKDLDEVRNTHHQFMIESDAQLLMEKQLKLSSTESDDGFASSSSEEDKTVSTGEASAFQAKFGPDALGLAALTAASNVQTPVSTNAIPNDGETPSISSSISLEKED